MSTECPMCHKQVEESFRVWSDKPFTAKMPLPGLAAWGGAEVLRTILCQSDRFVHFAFDHSGDEHLVEMVPDYPEEAANIRAHYERQSHQCEHDGCQKKGWPGWSLWGDEEPIGWYCDEHAYRHGFCPSCHYFYAGNEEFDFGDLELCGDCAGEMRRVLGEFDDVDDWDDWDEDD